MKTLLAVLVVAAIYAAAISGIGALLSMGSDPEDDLAETFRQHEGEEQWLP